MIDVMNLLEEIARAEHAFMDAVWVALKADVTDLEKQQRILNAYRTSLIPIIEKAVQAGLDAGAEVCAHWAGRYAGASDEAKNAKKRVETRDFETMSMACRFREGDIRALSAANIVKEMCGE